MPDTPELDAASVTQRTSSPFIRVVIGVQDEQVTAFGEEFAKRLSECGFATFAGVVSFNGGDQLRAPEPASISTRLYRALVDARYPLKKNPFSKRRISDVFPAEVPAWHGIPSDEELPFDVLVVDSACVAQACAAISGRAKVWCTNTALPEERLQAFLQPVVLERPVTQVDLIEFATATDRRVIDTLTLSTARAPSESQNVANAIWNAQSMLLGSLQRMAEHGESGVQSYIAKLPAGNENCGSPRISIVGWMAKVAAKKVARRFSSEGAGVDFWSIGLRKSPMGLITGEGESARAPFRWIKSPWGHFWADPFLVHRKGELWLYFEDYVRVSRRARICCAQVSNDGAVGEPLVAIERPYHLSFPHVFEADGEYWMIPESEQSGTIDLYRSVQFPDKWVFEKTLMNVRAVDTTATKSNGLWWLHFSPMYLGGHAPSTELYFADSLLGEWKRHPLSPISTDVRRSRGAGRLLVAEGRLLRPSQDCSRSYGYALNLNEVTVLSPEAYSESLLRKVEPSVLLGLSGVHTYGSAGGWEVIDGKRTVLTY